jgi:GNAT superfamily N-acetyltransferase
MARLEFLTDPVEVLRRAEDYLAADAVTGTVVATVTARAVAEAADGVKPPPGVPRWWALALDDSGPGGGRVVGVAMRTAPGAPYPIYVLPMPDEMAEALAGAILGRGERVTAVNGSLPAARVCADVLARRTGATVVLAQHTRLFEVHRVLPPPREVGGSLRRATEGDLELAVEWFGAFLAAADAQAGRPPGTTPAIDPPQPETVLRRIREGGVWFWEDESGERVHLTSANPPVHGVVRIGPVYTPPQRRGRGYASAAVAEVSARFLAEGVRSCLFTDQANPTSNALYQALGYEPVVDMANFVVDPGR